MKGFYEVVPFNFIKNLDEKDLGLKLAGVNKIDGIYYIKIGTATKKIIKE